jgi:hypothetical protein
MNFGDSYTEIQGNEQISNLSAQTYFQQQGNPGSCFVLCYQKFNGLTYGLTTGLNSDPTLKVPHNPLQVIPWQLIIVSVAIAAAAAVLGVTIVRCRRHRLTTRISPTTSSGKLIAAQMKLTLTIDAVAKMRT